MTRVVLSGYYGFDNTGDEAVLYSIIQGVRRELDDAEIVVLSNSPQQTALAYGVKTVNRWHVPQVTLALKNSDLLISGGGSLLQDVTGPNSVIYYLGLIWLAGRLGTKVMVFAQGIGPLQRPYSRALVKKVLSKNCDAVSVRDSDSREFLKSIGVSGEVHVTADPVLGLQVPRQNEAVERYLAGRGINAERLLLVCPRAWRDNTFIQPLIRALGRLAAEGYQVLLVPFHWPEDRKLCAAVTEQLKGKAYLLDEQMSIEDMLVLFQSAQLVIGMRLHSLVFAAVGGTPMVGISYDPKVDSFLAQVDQPCAGTAALLDASKLIRYCGEMLNAPATFRQRLERKRDTLNRQAMKNYQIMSSILAQ